MKRIILSALSLAISILSYAQIELPAKLTDRAELIIKHTGYTLSYNTTHNTPKRVAWVLIKSHTQGTEPRSNIFLEDPKVPTPFRVTSSDYTGSGYDRGHMAPAADMSYSPTSMHDSFYMSNICPQNPSLNRVSWKQLETAFRKWVHTEDTLFIIAGPVFNKTPRKIGNSHSIDIPIGFYKVILSLRRGHQKAIAFYHTNTSSKQSITSTAKTVDEIEKLTGLDFFYILPDSIENAVESQYNLNDWR